MLIHGDSLHELKNIDSDSIDLLCTDPPYGYSFMGKAWDKTLPDIGVFKECLRVLKPGAFAFVMSAPRSDVCARMMLLLEDAGFEIGFTPIYWTYASGFPKAMNIGKAVDKREGRERVITGSKSSDDIRGGNLSNQETKRITTYTTKGDGPLEGSYGGFQPKPAVEVIIVAMKPLSEKTYVDQALKNGKGITWLDDCRVPADTLVKSSGQVSDAWRKAEGREDRQPARPTFNEGRFPANLLVSDDVLNDGRVQKSGTAVRKNIGISTSKEVYGDYSARASDFKQDIGFGDSGSYSRYFDLDAWAKTLPFLIVPKAAKSEKNAGCEDLEEKFAPKGNNVGRDLDNPKNHLGGMQGSKQQNHHPTVKPLKLMSYLIMLGSRPGDTVLDPFLGSGTTAVAAKSMNRNYIGIEREEEYVRIAEARIAFK